MEEGLDAQAVTLSSICRANSNAKVTSGFLSSKKGTQIVSIFVVTLLLFPSTLGPATRNNNASANPIQATSKVTSDTQNQTAQGNLKAVGIQAVQVTLDSSIDLVSGKYTDFEITYQSTFADPIAADVLVDAPGFSPSSVRFNYLFQNGTHTFTVGSAMGSTVSGNSTSTFFTPGNQSQVALRFTIDPDKLLPETDKTDNVFPASGYAVQGVRETKPFRVLFIAVGFDGEDGLNPYGYGYYSAYPRQYFDQHVQESTDYLRAIFPISNTNLVTIASCFNAPLSAGPRPTTEEQADRTLARLTRELAIRAVNSGYDRAVGVVKNGWFDNIPGWQGTVGYTWGSPRGLVVTVGYWKDTVQEIGHTLGLKDSNLDGDGYYVIGRRFVHAQTIMSSSSIPYPVAQNSYQRAVPEFWIRPEEYQTLLNRFTFDRQRSLLVSSTFTSQSVTISNLSDSTSTSDLSSGAFGDYNAELLDSSGGLVYSAGINVTLRNPSNSRTVAELPVAFTLPYVVGARLFRIASSNGTVLATKTLANTPPSVHILSPNGGVLNGQTTLVSWTGNDTDGDPLTYSVFASGDRGLTWIPVASNLTETHYSMLLTGFSGGHNYLVKVIASDGTSSAEDTSGTPSTVGLFDLGISPGAQRISQAGTANFTISVTTFGAFNGTIRLNATSTSANQYDFRWIDGPLLSPAPNATTEAMLEITASRLVQGGNQTLTIWGSSGNNTISVSGFLFSMSHILSVVNATIITPATTYSGQLATVRAYVVNQGTFPENTIATLYRNGTLLTSLNSTGLQPGASQVLSFAFLTGDFARGYYLLRVSVVDDSGSGTAADSRDAGILTVRIAGDISGDGIVNIYDLVMVGGAFGSRPGDANWSAAADVNNDGVVNIFDLVLVGANFGHVG